MQGQARQAGSSTRIAPGLGRLLAGRGPGTSRFFGFLLMAVVAWSVGVPVTAQARSPQRRAPAMVVGLDARAGFDQQARFADGVHFEELRSLLFEEGVQVRALPDFDPRRLQDLDVLVLQQPFHVDQRIRPRERTAIWSFVAAGGSLLVLGDVGGRSDGQLDNLNLLLKPYGIRFGQAEDRSTTDPVRGWRASGWVVDEFVPHPITRGLRSFAVDYPRRLVEVRPPALDLTTRAGLDDVLAVAETEDGGRVVVIGDVSLWMDADAGSDTGLGMRGNRRLFHNVLAFLAPRPEPEAPLERVDTHGLQVRLNGLRDAWLGLPSTAAAVLSMLVPDSVASGRFVELSARGSQPGALLVVLLGEPTESGTLRTPTLLTTANANADGTVTFSVLIPSSAAGHTFGLRLLDPQTGETSPIVRIQPKGR